MYTLSIILNLHREGELAERTIQNLRETLKENNSWHEIEILAILDNPDESTNQIVSKNKDLFQKVEKVNFKDPAHSRNHGVGIATKNFILFADGDDYVSRNSLSAIYETFYNHYSQFIQSHKELLHLNTNQHIAVFPRYLIEFPNLFQMEYFNSTNFIVQNNKFTHCYHGKIATYRGLLTQYKINENKTPYGYEDWDLNNILLAKGIQYKISDYKLYYRRGNDNSVLYNHTKNKCIVRNSLIYEEKMHDDILSVNINIIGKTDKISTGKKNALRKFLSKSSLLKKIYHFFKNKMIHQEINQDSFKEDKVFLQSYGEKTSIRKDIQFANTGHLASNLSTQVKIYEKLLKFLSDKEMVYFFPWIGLGGADKVSVEYTKALSTKNSCVITSISSGARIDVVKVPHLDLLSELEGWDIISEDEQLHILVKAIINSKIKLIHVVNSDIALKTIKYYDKIYREYNIKTIVTLFCPDYDWINMQYHGYPIMYPELFTNANLILSDNNYWYSYFKKLNRNQDFVFKKLSSPTEEIKASYKLKNKNTKKILWASRVCNQKLFSVFEEIVNKLDNYEFIIYGDIPGDEDNKRILKRLMKKKNIEFRGEYQHISEIDLNEFDLYLFTSLFEGIPTIILDMVMSGIPVVSADVGGIHEVFGKGYPLLVKDQSDANKYIEKIEEYYKNKDRIVPKMLEIRNSMMKSHNTAHFQHEYNTAIKDIMHDHR